MSAPSTTGSVLTQLSDALAAAVERAALSTVTVHGRQRLSASGIVWSSDGYVVTASHVVERDDDLTIGLGDGRTVAATLVGRDQGSDLALLKLDAADLTPATQATAPVKPGHLVLAVGRPGQSGAMASFGAVTVVGGPWRTTTGGTIETFIRADVAMLPGFSGGPLVDGEGQVIGLNSSTIGRGGGLTIPAAAIDSVIAVLKQHGKVRRGYLGVAAQAARIPTALATELGQERGLLIVGVEPESPAESGGLLLGDVLLSVAGTPVTEVDELQAKLAGDLAGQPAALRLLRGGQPHDLTVTIGER